MLLEIYGPFPGAGGGIGGAAHEASRPDLKLPCKLPGAGPPGGTACHRTAYFRFPDSCGAGQEQDVFPLRKETPVPVK